MKNKKWTKAALALSSCLFVLWWALGTGATLAWFSDADSVRNEFQVGLLKMDVSYRNDIVTEYTPLQGTTKAFNDEALYEPGYTQVVYLKIENTGDLAFKYKAAVTVEGYTNGRNAYCPDRGAFACGGYEPECLKCIRPYVIKPEAGDLAVVQTLESLEKMK